jgi:drug/metabolite transporter superfamily protein YnfA
MTPDLHAALLRGAAVLLLVMSAVVLTRHPTAVPGRAHAAYGVTASWWLFATSMVAAAATDAAALLWSRLAMVGVGMLPGVVYHLNAATAGIAAERRQRIQLYYGLSIALTTFAVASPFLLAAPQRFTWGYSPGFTRWGLLPVALLLVVFVEALAAFRDVMRRCARGSGPVPPGPGVLSRQLRRLSRCRRFSADLRHRRLSLRVRDRHDDVHRRGHRRAPLPAHRRHPRDRRRRPARDDA